jgi:hypothetical protein
MNAGGGRYTAYSAILPAQPTSLPACQLAVKLQNVLNSDRERNCSWRLIVVVDKATKGGRGELLLGRG